MPTCSVCKCCLEGHAQSKNHFRALWLQLEIDFYHSKRYADFRESYWLTDHMRLKGLDEALTVRFNNLDFEVQICKGQLPPSKPLPHVARVPPPPAAKPPPAPAPPRAPPPPTAFFQNVNAFVPMSPSSAKPPPTPPPPAVAALRDPSLPMPPFLSQPPLAPPAPAASLQHLSSSMPASIQSPLPPVDDPPHNLNFSAASSPFAAKPPAPSPPPAPPTSPPSDAKLSALPPQDLCAFLAPRLPHAKAPPTSLQSVEMLPLSTFSCPQVSAMINRALRADLAVKDQKIDQLEEENRALRIQIAAQSGGTKDIVDSMASHRDAMSLAVRNADCMDELIDV